MEKFESDDRFGAEGCFQKAVAMAPNFGLPHLYLGNLFSENRDLVKANRSLGTIRTTRYKKWIISLLQDRGGII
ncbi:MAG: hypothetical protein CM1200mP10_13640 [Candidatus Neomarinimicrobiota bacterium]|nr:MAG: hypothetical protein CM1200mP10_13640 [Candidatus Neomarinimicrobiota bacterium]